MFSGYKKQRDFLICIDSDGCAIDSMNWKHHLCFGPAFVEEWDLIEHESEALSVWNQVNLYSYTRGVNRFLALCKTLELLQAKNIAVEDFYALKQWTQSAKELSNYSLEIAANNKNSPILQKALRWSLNVNRLISSAGNNGSPFAAAVKVIPTLADRADLVVVSSANREAVEAEWKEAGLYQYLSMVCTQEQGTKAFCIARLLQKGYGKSHVLMVGDAMGDMQAAEQNGVLFYPIIAGSENESWENFISQGADMMFGGSFSKQHQQHLNDDFKNRLSGSATNME